jgi:hypothetical protein
MNGTPLLVRNDITGVAGSPVVRPVALGLALLVTILLLNLGGLLITSQPLAAG